jgi:UDP-N-acetylglucosamine 2-epimerase (non-hydrolysing)
MEKARLAFILGIRPDVIRAALVINQLRRYDDMEMVFIWSGQHYSDNLKSIFFRELDIAPAEIDLGCGGETDADVVASVISRLYPVLRDMKPAAAVFLGDTNTTTGAIAAAQLNIPIVHIEGCMRSYDWRMPEEKYRTVIDHLADRIYTYYPEYKQQGVNEGLNPRNIVIIQNLIVDVLQHYFFDRADEYEALANDAFFSSRGLERGEFFLMTCHRRESVEDPKPLTAILELMAASPHPIYFTASYRTQKRLKEFGLTVPDNTIMVDPIGYRELLALLVNSRGALTDSGTVVEETAVLGVPSLQIRKATERPQVYDVGSSVKFDPARPEDYPHDEVYAKLEYLRGQTWDHQLGDGKASERLVEDLVAAVNSGDIRGHTVEHQHLDVSRSYREDGLSVPSGEPS